MSNLTKRLERLEFVIAPPGGGTAAAGEEKFAVFAVALDGQAERFVPYERDSFGVGCWHDAGNLNELHAAGYTVVVVFDRERCDAEKLGGAYFYNAETFENVGDSECPCGGRGNHSGDYKPCGEFSGFRPTTCHNTPERKAEVELWFSSVEPRAVEENLFVWRETCQPGDFVSRSEQSKS